MKRKIVAACAAFLFALPLTACGNSSDQPADPVTVTASPEAPATSESVPEVTPETPETPEVNQDEEFAQIVREGAPYFATDPTEDIIYLAETICGAFDNGNTFEAIGQVIVDSGAPAYDAGFVIGASVAYLCPEHEAQIEAETGSNA